MSISLYSVKGNKTDTTDIQTKKTINEPTYISLSSIEGLHPRIIELDKEYAGISPINLASIKISEEALTSLMILNPIIIRRTGAKLFCVGNTLTFSLAIMTLKRNKKVPIIELKRSRIVEIEKLYWAERLVAPITMNLGRSPHKWLFHLWGILQNTFPDLWKRKAFPDVNSTREFADLIKVDPRSLE